MHSRCPASESKMMTTLPSREFCWEKHRPLYAMITAILAMGAITLTIVAVGFNKACSAQSEVMKAVDRSTEKADKVATVAATVADAAKVEAGRVSTALEVEKQLTADERKATNEKLGDIKGDVKEIKETQKEMFRIIRSHDNPTPSAGLPK